MVFRPDVSQFNVKVAQINQLRQYNDVVMVNSSHSDNDSENDDDILTCTSYKTQECWNGGLRQHTVVQKRTAREVHSRSGYRDHNQTQPGSSKCTRQPLKADMNDVYSGILRCAMWTIEYRDGLWSLLKKKKISLPSKDALHLVQNSKANKATPALARLIFLLKDFKGNAVNNVCLVQYHVSNVDGRVEDLQIQKHGNSRSTNPKPFYPLKKSTLAMIRDNVIKRGSQGVYDDLRKKAGGTFGASNVSELPGGKQQIYNAKSRISSSVSEDDVEELLKCAAVKRTT